MNAPPPDDHESTAVDTNKAMEPKALWYCIECGASYSDYSSAWQCEISHELGYKSSTAEPHDTVDQEYGITPVAATSTDCK